MENFQEAALFSDFVGGFPTSLILGWLTAYIFTGGFILDAVPEKDAEHRLVRSTDLKTSHLKDDCHRVPEAGKALC